MSGETRWTKGPWRVETDTGADTVDVVAAVPGCLAWTIACDVMERADADLIAAAPALYEALADAEEILSAAAAGWDVKSTSILKALDAASTALRAARGETKEPDRAVRCVFCGSDKFTVRVASGKVFCEVCMKEVP